MSEKKLCKLAKKSWLNEHLQEYVELIRDPTWICTKCGRPSNDERRLCKPVPLGDNKRNQKPA